jgi:hypothetical protein
MPSSVGPDTSNGIASRALAIIKSQGFGIACGLLTTLLLAVGSFVIAATGEGASAGVSMDDATIFFSKPSLWHAWFYLLIPVLGMFGLSTLLCTLDSVVEAWQAGRRVLSAYAPAILHLSFLLAMLAHAVGGFLGREDGVVAIGPSWTSLPDGRTARALSVTIEEHPDGTPQQVSAGIELRGLDGVVIPATVAYNQPISSGGGSDLLLMIRAVSEPRGVRLTSGPEACEMDGPGKACVLAGRTIRLTSVSSGGHWGDTPVAYMQIEGATESKRIFLWPGATHMLNESGASFRLEKISQVPTVMVRSRHAPGNPWALAAALVLGFGLVAMGRRWGFGSS